MRFVKAGQTIRPFTRIVMPPVQFKLTVETWVSTNMGRRCAGMSTYTGSGYVYEWWFPPEPGLVVYAPSTCRVPTMAGSGIYGGPRRRALPK